MIEPKAREPFRIALQHLLNSYSKDNETNTPDYVLTEYLLACLNAYSEAVHMSRWHELG
jgi:hypothetical protein